MNNSKTSKIMKFFVLSIICMVGLLINSVFAQTVHISPSGDGGFENGNTFESNGWSVLNAAPLGSVQTPGANTWHVGNSASMASGNNAAYISSTGGATYGYNNLSATTSSFYRTINSTSLTESIMTLSFQWKGFGENGWDRLMVYVAPDASELPGTNNPTSNSTIMQGVAGYQNIYLQSVFNQTSFTQASVTIPSTFIGTTFKLYFVFQSDASFGTSPGPAVDNISLIGSEPVTFTSTATGGLWSSPETWVGGVVPPAANDIVIAAGSQVNIDGVTSYRNITVDGTLQWMQTGGVLNVYGNLVINPTGRFIGVSGTTGIITINLLGNFTNNGYANLVYSVLQFQSTTGTTIDGTGYFEGDGTRGFIRSITCLNGSNAINTTQNLTVTSGYNPLFGTLNTNGKVRFDNTASVYGRPFNQQVQGVPLNYMGMNYTEPPIIFGASVTPYASGINVSAGQYYAFGENVYVATAAGVFNATAPTSTGNTLFLESGVALMWVGKVGTLGTPLKYGGTGLSLSTSYVVGDYVYRATTTAPVTTFPTHTSGLVDNLMCIGTAAKVTSNFDATTGTVRSLNLVHPGSGLMAAPSLVFSVANANGSGTNAAALVQFWPRMLGNSTDFHVQKNGQGTISGGLEINSDQGTSSLTTNPQASSGAGHVSVLDGGVNYTVAPLVGFAGPTALNLVSNPGSGYVTTPTVVVTGGTLVNGTALANSNFTITMNQGKIVSVYLTSGTARYSVPPTLSFSGGGATLAFPEGCWPVATAIIGSNGALKEFVVTNSGYGYVSSAAAAVGATSGTAAGGTFSVRAGDASQNGVLFSLLGAYRITYGYFAGASAATENTDDQFIPANRKLKSIALSGNGNGLSLENNLTLWGSSPLSLGASGNTPGNILNLGGYNLNFTWNLYAGTASPKFNASNGNAYIKNGSISLTNRGGGTAGRTLNFPFDMLATVFTGTGSVTTGSDITRVTVSQVPVSNAVTGGTGLAIGNRAYKIDTDGASGTNPKVTLTYANLDSLTTAQNATVVVNSASASGAWNIVSPAFGTSNAALPSAPLSNGNYGALATFTGTGTTPIAFANGSTYFSWGTGAPVVSSVLPLTACAYSEMITITGSGFEGVTAVSIGGTPVSSFTIVSNTEIAAFAANGPSGVISVTKLNGNFAGTETVTINLGPSSPTLSTTAISTNYGSPISIAVVSPSANTIYNWYDAQYDGFAAVTDSVFTGNACGNLYVSAGAGLCESQRTMVTLTIAYPQIVSSDEFFCGAGGGVSLTAAPLAPNASIVWGSLTSSAVLSSTSANPTSTTITETSDFSLTLSVLGCPDYSTVKSIGVYPLPTAEVTSSATGVCPGTSATINSGLSAGNFSYASIPIGMQPAPENAVTLVANGLAAVPQTSSSLDDGAWSALPIGFDFNYFGTNHASINIGTNGTVHLGPYNASYLTDFTFTTFPSLTEPPSVIGAACHDMNFNSSFGAINGSIKYWTQGYAPNRRFIVQFENARAYNSSGATAKYTTTQIHLLETLGSVEIHVPSSTATYNKVVGLQDQTRTIGAVALATTGVITNQAWRFSPPSDYTTVWTANGDALAAGTNLFTQIVAPTITTLYDISYTNTATGCSNDPGSAQVNMIVLGSDVTANFSATTTSPLTTCAGLPVVLGNDYLTASGLVYQWQLSIDGGVTYTDIATATSGTTIQTVNGPTSYRVGISQCGGAFGYSSPVNIVMDSYLACFMDVPEMGGGLCAPDGSGTALDEEITNVTLGSLNNSSTCTDTASGPGSVVAEYGNYTSSIPALDIYQGASTSGSITVSTCGTSNYNSGLAIFIDYNRNGMFDNEGERAWANGTGADISCLPDSVVPISFSVPLSATPGLALMRIINWEGQPGQYINPCAVPNYGEIEDYVVNIVGPPAAPSAPTATSSGSCIAGDTISMVGTAPANVTYYWQTTATGTSMDNSDPTLVVYSNGTYYLRAYTSIGGQWSTASSITLSAFPIVTPPPAITNLSGSPYCDAVTLQAGTAPLDITYYWQGTNPTGTSIALPAAVNSTATSSGTYFIAARNDTTLCWSETTSINVVVYSVPSGSALGALPSSCDDPMGSVLFNVYGSATVFASDFSSTVLPSNATLEGNDVEITTSGQLQLTSSDANMQGAILINNTTDLISDSYQLDFDLITTAGTLPAGGGLSYSYGPDVVAIPQLPTEWWTLQPGDIVPPTQTNMEHGTGSALKIGFDSYTNTFNSQGIYLMYNCPIYNPLPTSVGVLTHLNNTSWRATQFTGVTTHVTVKVNSAGQLSMWLNGDTTIVNQQLPAAYLSEDKSQWKHAISARTDYYWQGYYIDNVNISYDMYEYSLDSETTWTTSNPVAALPGTYPASVRYLGVGGCVTSLGAVTVPTFNISSVSIGTAPEDRCPGQSLVLSASVAGQANGLTYNWQTSLDNGTTWVNVPGGSALMLVTSQVAATSYRLGASYCSGDTSYTSPVVVNMSDIQTCYCTPAPTNGTTDGDLISSVQILGTTLNNNTGFVNGTPAYNLYNTLPNHTASLLPSSTYTLTVSTGEWGNQGLAAWIDYNDDAIFQTSERVGATATTIGSGVTPGAVNATASFNITLACAPPAGLHRMRIRTVFGTSGVNLNPCTNYQWGETEDYFVTVLPAPSCPSAGIFAQNLNILPATSSAAFTWPYGCATTTVYDFEYGPNGFTPGTGTLVLSQSVDTADLNASYVLSGLSGSSFYDVYARPVCDSASVGPWSNLVAVATAPSGPATSPQTFCTGATVADLVATPASGAFIYWYESATSTAWLSNSDVLISGTYYASQVINGIESTERTATAITIIESGIITTTVAVCALDYVWNGQTYTGSGIYEGPAVGCATTQLNLTLTPPNYPTISIASSQTEEVCQGTPITFTATAGDLGTPAAFCDYTFNMYDDYGDSWNGNTMSILQGSVVIATLTGPEDNLVDNEYAPNTLAQTLSLQAGLTYTLFWNFGGSFPEEVGVSVVNPSGVTIYSMPVFSDALRGTALTTIVGNCTSTSYAWQVNGVAVPGETGSSFTSSTIPVGASVTASVISVAECMATTPTISAPITPAISPVLVPEVTVNQSELAVCAGAPVTFTASGSPANVAEGVPCDYTFNMLDSWGDGWNGGQMQVMNGSTIVATLTFAANENCFPCTANSLSQTVSLQSGTSYSLVWNTAGLYPEEVGVQVVSSSGVTVYSMGYNSQALAGTTLATIAADCPSVSPYQWSLNGSPIAGETSATYTSSTLSSTDVVTVSYTTNAPCNSTAPVVSSGVSVNVIANTVNTTTAEAYVSYSWNGQTYTASGVYDGETTNCVTEQLNLTILTMPLVTFQVDMAQSNAPAGAIPYVNGTFNGWCGVCNPMTNIGGSVWSLTIPLMPQTYEYKFTYNGYDGEENLLAGTSCTVTNFGYTNRFLVLGTTDVVLPLVCWNLCSTCVTQAAVTFSVDMSQSGAPAGSIPEVNGTFNGWCGNCNAMTDADGDGVWETTVLIAEGSYEYKFSYSNWSGQEALTPGSSCTATTDGYTNRTLAVAGSQAMVLPVVCWNSCSACTSNATLAVNVFIDGYYNVGSSPASMVSARYTNLEASGSSSPGAATDVDMITVQLRSASNLEVAAYSVNAILQTNGNVECVFPAGALTGSYYIVVLHRASNPVWSASPVTLTASSSYSFSSSQSSAYGISPMHQLTPSLHGLWLGEMNDDDYLDASDFSVWEQDQFASEAGGYLLDGDFNGDSFVDPNDFPVFDFNSQQGVEVHRPY